MSSGRKQFDGELIHCAEGRIQTFVHQKIGIVVKQIHGLLAVELVAAHCQFSRKMVQGKKLQQRPHPHLEPELLSNGLGLGIGDAGDFCKSAGFPLHDGQSVFTEVLHDPGRHPGSDALNDPAGQVTQDLHAGLGHEPLQKLRFKLFAVALMGAPAAGDQEPLAHGGPGDGAHHRVGLAVGAVQAQYGIAIVIILIHHGADGTLEDLHFHLLQIDPLSSVSFFSSLQYFGSKEKTLCRILPGTQALFCRREYKKQPLCLCGCTVKKLVSK